jgi:hypothetical protein
MDGWMDRQMAVFIREDHPSLDRIQAFGKTIIVPEHA